MIKYFLILFTLMSGLFAQTILPQSISGSYDASGNPYYITEDIYLLDDVVFEEGVEIFVSPGLFSIMTTDSLSLTLNGTSTSPVTIQSTSGDVVSTWGGIEVPNITMRNSRISGMDNGIIVSDLDMENSEITTSRIGIYGFGGSHLQITNSIFNEIDNTTLSVTGGFLELSESTFTNNASNSSSVVELNSNASANISMCEFYDNAGTDNGGVINASFPDYNGAYININNNTFDNNLMAIKVEAFYTNCGGSYNISNNVLSNNEIGFYYYNYNSACSGNLDVTRNTIVYNGIGLAVKEGSIASNVGNSDGFVNISSNILFGNNDNFDNYDCIFEPVDIKYNLFGDESILNEFSECPSIPQGFGEEQVDIFNMNGIESDTFANLYNLYPMFEDFNSNDYELLAGSPCINAGEIGLGFDADGTFVEIGAFTYNASSDVYGCTDPSAINYDSEATIDDGTCEYDDEVYGCTYDNASNYNPDATEDDGSCEFYSLGDFNQDGSINILDIVSLVQSILNAF